MSVDFKAKFSGSAETFSATMSEAPAGMTASMKETGGGTAYDGTGAKIIIKGKEVRCYGKQRTLAAIRAGQCRPPALRP